jgi:hypothetical protein
MIGCNPKRAVNGVENGIGVRQTVWADPPENHLLEQNMMRQIRAGDDDV